MPERGGSADLRWRKVNSHGLADPTKLQEESEVSPRTCDAEKKVSLHGLVHRSRLQEARARWLGEHPARLQEARARWLGEHTVEEIKLARVSKPSKVERGQSELARQTYGGGKLTRTGSQTQQSCQRHERGGSANLRCWKVSSHGLADPPRLQEARASWLGELALQESKLAQVSTPDLVARGTSEVARRTCGTRN
ncbi:hypothetical protein CRG98_016486 [Punica granatum]|uniref:Uncharacterized protein n=1 Tax=Punica granatum TaxID=22663 RepID=A0A2I0K605_PUNGR|nr:hypothetical protein CRG98_016486 [Punica granatum]